MLIGTLNVGVRTFITRTAGPNGKRKTLTTIFVRMGDMVIAERTSAGKWTAADALKEFKRFPARFTPRGTFTTEQIKAIAA